jgi:hypothetical protein
VPGEVAAAAKARHVAHEFTVRDLELVQPLYLGAGLGHICRPDNLGEISIRLGGSLVHCESGGEALGLRCRLFAVARAPRGGAGEHDQEAGEQVSAGLHHHPMLVPRARGYRPGVSLQALRGRMPLLAFIFLALVCLALFGFACACLSDHPIQAVDRIVGAMGALPALIEVWGFAAVAALASAAVFGSAARPRARAPAPAVLQRFLL